ncbi:rhodanese-like domain-containing protein [Haloferula sargassicola]|uniref:Rhodanese domain-containing protein n=1 Tax=Haloferula sargassicola TaxID=490096 RepID=A0ABP9UPL0_9BACT
MRVTHEMTAIVAAAVLLSAGHWLADGRPSGIPAVELAKTPLKEGEIALATLQEEGLDGVVFIDARKPEEWRADGLEGSINVTTLSDQDLVQQLEPHLERLMTARRIVVYCGDIHCGLSHELAERLRDGFSDVLPGRPLVLQGGMTALREAGLVKETSYSS